MRLPLARTTRDFLTIEAALVSQFEQQVRALCELPLGPTDLAMPAAMVNLLGDLWTLAGGRASMGCRAEARSGRANSSLREADADPRAKDGSPDGAAIPMPRPHFTAHSAAHRRLAAGHRED